MELKVWHQKVAGEVSAVEPAESDSSAGVGDAKE
jgi:hypothetical protein